MQPKLDADIRNILEVARFAPSVHNTQPWKVKIQNNRIVVNLDGDHLLTDGDPTGRETIISLGIFAEALRLATESRKFGTESVKLVNRSAEIQVSERPSDKKDDLVNMLKRRCTDRSIYVPIDITDTMSQKIINAWDDDGSHIHLITSREKINKIADITSKGIRLAMSNPNFRRELSQYLLMPWSKKKRGIAVSSLHIPWLAAVLQPLLVKLGVEIDAEVRLEKRRWESASGIVPITTPGDMPDDWFNAGRAYLTVSLVIESLGLAQATSAATVEASDYHEDIEDMIGTKERLQCVTRIGRTERPKKFSPRVSAEELLAAPSPALR